MSSLSSNSENNKKIIKNTLALYFRQIITIAVSLFTSRIILQTLGVTDYGINNVVGGVLVMLSFLTTSLSNTTQRFLNVEMGKNDGEELKKVFSNSLSLYLVFIFLVITLAETAGLWFVQNKLVIPPERADAAFWVYQFSVTSFAISVFFTPFEGAVRAHEKFGFYAKLSIFDVVMKVVVVGLLVVLPFDKLIALALMMKCVVILNKIILYVFCRRNFEECKIRLSWMKKCVRRLLGYNIYKLIDSVSVIIKTQGLNIVLNLYYGPVLNAAQGIANTIYVSLYSFTGNAMIATNPQIVQSYAKNDKPRLWSLVTKSSRLYFFLLLVLVAPFILETDTALFIWLGNYPEYTTVFVKLFLLDALLKVLFSSVSAANAAVGKLRAFTMNLFICRLLVLAVAVFIGMNKFSPIYIYVTYLAFQTVCIFIALVLVLKMQLNFSLRQYYMHVIWPILKTSLLVFSLPVVLHYYFSKSILFSCGVGFFTFIWSMIVVFYVGLNKHEKQMVLSKLPFFKESNRQ